MTRPNRTGLLVVPALAAGLIVLASMSGSSGSNDPPKPSSVEDELRDVKRRLEKLEGERGELTKRAGAAEVALEKERADRKDALEKANARVDGAIAQAKLDRVPLGAMIPYFGTQLPEGYRWCNGNDPKDHPKGDNVYPNASWVPKRLVGAPLPDMREHLLGGAPTEAEVGQVFDKGRIVLEPFTIDGKKFTLPTKQVRLGGDGFIYRWVNDQGWDIGKKSDAKDLPKWFKAENNGRYWMELQPVRAFVDLPQATAAGEHVLKDVQSKPLNGALTNPRHIMCRWIIRVQ